MRIEIPLSPEVFRKLESRAIEQGVTVKSLIDSLLGRGLDQPVPGKASPETIPGEAAGSRSERIRRSGGRPAFVPIRPGKSGIGSTAAPAEPAMRSRTASQDKGGPIVIPLQYLRSGMSGQAGNLLGRFPAEETPPPLPAE